MPSPAKASTQASAEAELVILPSLAKALTQASAEAELVIGSQFPATHPPDHLVKYFRVLSRPCMILTSKAKLLVLKMTP